MSDDHVNTQPLHHFDVPVPQLWHWHMITQYGSGSSRILGKPKLLVNVRTAYGSIVGSCTDVESQYMLINQYIIVNLTCLQGRAVKYRLNQENVHHRMFIYFKEANNNLLQYPRVYQYVI